MYRQCFVAAVCNRHAIFLLGVADAIRRHVAARFSFASTVTDRRYKATLFPDNFRLFPMKSRVILTALLVAPLLLGRDVAPSPAPAADWELVSSELTDDEEGCIDSVDTTPALADHVRQLEEILGNLRKLTENELLEYAARLRLPDGVIQPGFPEYLELKRQLQELLDRGLTRKHPDVVAKSKEIDAIRKQLDEGVVALWNTLQANLELANDRYKRALAAKLVHQKQEDAIRKALESPDYIDAERIYMSEQDVLQVLKLNLFCTQNPTAEATAGLRAAFIEQEHRVEQARQAMAEIGREAIARYEGRKSPQPARKSPSIEPE